MKGSAFLSLILAALLTAGCSGEKKDQPVLWGLIFLVLFWVWLENVTD